MADLTDPSERATISGSIADPAIAHVTLAGELDLASVPGVERQLEAFLHAGPDRVVFDMSAVAFMDSSGIAMLLRAAERVSSVEIREPSAAVQLVLRATGLSEVLHVDP